MTRLTHVPSMIRELETLKSIAAEIEGIFHDVRRDAPTIHTALRQVRKAGGEYVLTEMVDNEAAEFDPRLPKKLARDSYFGSMRGDALVGANCKFLTEVRRYEQWLLSFDGCDNEERAMEATIGLLERREAAKAVRYIGEAGRRMEKLRWAMSAACFFFADTHIEDMKEWARDRLQPHPFSVDRHVRNDGISLTFSRVTGKDEEREYARLFLSNALAVWAEANRIAPNLEN